MLFLPVWQNYAILILMNLKKLILTLLLFLLISQYLNILISPVHASRKRIRKPTGQAANYTPQGVTARVRFRADRLGLLINFSNFENLSSGTYELIYEANGVTQGAGGSIILGDASTKELLFGTCSGSVCSFHENITNARLSIISVLKNGTTVLKPFRIKV